MTRPQPNGGFEWAQAPWGAVLRCTPLAAAAAHVFTAAPLRLVDDEREWSAVAEYLGVADGGIRLIRQVHGTAVAVASAGDGRVTDRTEADIAISDDPDVAIAVRVADCAPVLLADSRLGVVGAAHAGWRGTMQRVAAEAVSALQRTFGSRPGDLVAAIGPCLGPCCGEMGAEVIEMFRAAGHRAHHMERWFSPGPAGRPHLDLWAANRDQLEGAGVPASRVFLAELCTKTHASVLHSYRAHGPGAARMAAAIRAVRP